MKHSNFMEEGIYKCTFTLPEGFRSERRGNSRSSERTYISLPRSHVCKWVAYNFLKKGRAMTCLAQNIWVRNGSIAFLAIIASIGCLHGDFVFDDTEAIVNNQDVTSSGPLLEIFSNDFWGTKLIHKNSHKSYRPLTVASFRCNFWLHGKLVPWSFHIGNTILHVISCLTLYHVYDVLVGQDKNYVSLWACWIFAVHPIHTEAVCGIVGRADVFAAIFFFLSFLLFAHADLKTGVTSYLSTLLSVVLAGLAMLSKEHGITVLGFNIIYEVLAVQKISISKLLKCNITELKRMTFKRVLILLFSTVALVYLRYLLMGLKGPTFQPVDNPASFQEDWLFRSLSLQYIATINVWLLLCPDWLCFDWSMGCIPLIQQISDVRILAPVLCLLLFVSIAAKICSMPSNDHQRTILLSFALMTLPFLPASNILFRVGFVVAERILYIPSAGFCLLVALGLDKIFTKRDVTVPFAILLIIFAIKSHTRNLDWRTETSLFSSALKVCPNNAKVRYNIAKSAADRGHEDLAIAEYREAIRLFPDYDQALNNLANLVKSRGELFEADKLLRRALKIRPEFPAAWMNLGIVLSGLKKFPEAEKCYINALKLRKSYPDCYYNLGNLYLEKNMPDQAEAAWRNSIELKPKMSVAWNNLIILKDNAGNHSEAVEIGEQALQRAGNESSFQFNIANALGKLSRFEESEKHFKMAISLDSNNAVFHVNLGVLYHRWKRYSDAEKSYQQAMKINPHLQSAKVNYEMLKKSIRRNQGTL